MALTSLSAYCGWQSFERVVRVRANTGTDSTGFIAKVVVAWVALAALLVIPAYVTHEAAPTVLAKQTVHIDMLDFDFSEDVLEVGPGTDLNFVLHNIGDAQHNFGRNDEDVTDRIKAGDTGTYAAGVIENDTIFFCLIPGHRDLGMELRVNVAAS